jgi:hypothetical protein
MKDLSGDLSGSVSGNQVHPTRICLLPTTTWMRFVGNVGFLRQKRALAISGARTTGGLE